MSLSGWIFNLSQEFQSTPASRLVRRFPVSGYDLGASRRRKCAFCQTVLPDLAAVANADNEACIEEKS